jgi:hypothetical protein
MTSAKIPSRGIKSVEKHPMIRLTVVLAQLTLALLLGSRFAGNRCASWLLPRFRVSVEG